MEQSVQIFDSESPFGQTSTYRYGVNAFSGGSDHSEFNNATFKIPCIMLIQWPDLYYHSSADNLDKVSEDSLKRVGWIATVASLTLANATVREEIHFTNLTRLGGLNRLQKASKEASTLLFQKEKTLSRRELPEELAKVAYNYKNRIKHIAWREKKAITSVKTLGNNPELKDLIGKSTKDIEHYSQIETRRFEENLRRITGKTSDQLSRSVQTPSTEAAKKIIPKRLFKGPLSSENFKKSLGTKKYKWYQEIVKEDKDFRKKIYEILNFMDGKRSIYEITKAVSAEYNETNVEHVFKLIRDLKATNFVSY
jgi:hypothetical protein